MNTDVAAHVTNEDAAPEPTAWIKSWSTKYGNWRLTSLTRTANMVIELWNYDDGEHDAEGQTTHAARGGAGHASEVEASITHAAEGKTAAPMRPRRTTASLMRPMGKTAVTMRPRQKTQARGGGRRDCQPLGGQRPLADLPCGPGRLQEK